MTNERKLELTLWDQGAYGLKISVHSSTTFMPTLMAECDPDDLSSISIKGVLEDHHCKPIFFDLDSLTKEITIGGETFVPLVEIFKLLRPFTRFSTHGHDRFKKQRWFYDEKGSEVAWIEAVIDQESGILEGFDTVEKETRRFNSNQAKAFDWLDQHHFNRRGLDPDQFINVKDLETNPY